MRLLRWWNGYAWSDKTQPAPTAAPGPAYGSVYTSAVDRISTPDGEELAGWGRRLSSHLIDSVLVFALTVLLGIPFVARIVDYYADVFRESYDAAREGRPAPQPPGQLEIWADLWQPMLGMAIVGLLTGLIYHACFLRWKAATPGKLMLGTRVRLREAPGPLAWGTIFKRWLAQFGVTILGSIPFVGFLVSFYPFLDGLWPLWDDKRQALYDKFAVTNVVRVR